MIHKRNGIPVSRQSMKQSATHRAFAILELLVGRPAGLGLGEICARLDIPKSIVHRLLALLAERGLVRQDPATGHYALTLELSLMGARHLAGIGLVDVGQPILDRLAAATGELCRLAVVEGEGMVWVAKAQGARYGLRYDPDAGTRVVLHATATGKAWLATLPEAEAMRIVEATGFVTPRHFGPNAISEGRAFSVELARTRERGYGLALEEGEAGIAAVAVVVRRSTEASAPAVGTLSVAGPVTRLTPDRCRQLANGLGTAAAELSALWPIRLPLGGVAARSTAQGHQPDEGAMRHVA
jgi:DNA-binding IclR family transcriptional regulator